MSINIIKYLLLIVKKIVKKRYLLYIALYKLYSCYSWYKYMFYFYIIFNFYKLYTKIEYLIKNEEMLYINYN